MSTVQLNIGYLNMLFAQSSDMVFYTRKIGDDYVYEYINEAASVTIPNIAVGKTVSEVMDEKLRKTIFKYYDEAIATMGVVMYPYDATDLQCLIDLADKMLYEAKSIRRNSFKIYCAQVDM